MEATDFGIAAPGFYVFNRYAGSVLMLCDRGTTPGTTTTRYVAVAQSVAEGGVAPEAVTSAAALAGMRFYKLFNCAYQSANGSQDQNAAADNATLRLEFDTAGNATSNAMSMTFTAAEFSDMLVNGSSVAGLRFTAWRFTIDGQPRVVLVERSDYDTVNQTPGMVQLWLPQESSNGRGDDDLDLPLRLAQAGLHGGPRRRVPGHDPRVPDRIHRRELGHVGDEDLGHQDLRLVAAGARQQRVDRPQHLARLPGHVLRALGGDLPREMNRAVVHGHFRQARADVEALNFTHDVFAFCPIFDSVPAKSFLMLPWCRQTSSAHIAAIAQPNTPPPQISTW